MDDSTKPGYQTTEFWLSLIAIIISVVMGSGLIVDTSPLGKIIGIAAAVLTALGYTASRTIVKKK